MNSAKGMNKERHGLGGSWGQGTGLFLLLALILGGCVSVGRIYQDDRPYPLMRMDAVDHGVVLRHGAGPDSCDAFGARDVWVFDAGDRYVMHYDGSGPQGWLAVRAHSKGLMKWHVDGPVLTFGKKGEDDAKSASYGVTTFDGKNWHMFYLGARNTSPAPDLVPYFPYVTMKAKSSSPLGPWRKQAHVVPFRPTPGTYYAHTASPGQTIHYKGEYLQFFSASVIDGGIKRTLGLARTRNLDSTWVVDPEPVFPLDEQIENSSIYYEESNKLWFLFTNHIGWYEGSEEYTDAIWVYWSPDPTRWDREHKAIVLDNRNCTWSKRVIGLPSVVRFGHRLAVIYDGVEGEGTSHVKRDIGLAWLRLPLVPPQAHAEK
jgi:predicted GH43/DUF377 family glycosyl hydrolase